MQVKWFQSLSMKLFVLMSICLIFTVGAVTWQQSSVLQDFLHRQLEDTTVLKSKEIAGTLAAQLQHWRGLATLAMARMSGTTPEVYGEFIASLANSDPDLQAFELIDSETGKSLLYKAKSDGVLAQSKAAKELESSLRAFTSKWAHDAAKMPPTHRLEIADLRGTVHLPLLALAVRIKVAQQKSELWAILIVQSQKLLATFGDASTMRGWIVDGNQHPLLASDADGAAAGIDNVLAAAMGAAKSEFGFKSYKNSAGDDLLGAYTQLPDYGLTAVVTQDASGARLAILKTLVHTLLWAWFFVLCAVLLSYMLSQGVTRHLKAATLATQRIAGGDFTANLTVTGHDEVAALSHSVNSMAAQIRVLLESKVAAARQEKELETARLVQETLFPVNSLCDGPVTITAKTVPASECGGDWWGHFKAKDDRHYLFIADATGHGAAAAIVSAIAYSVCHTLASFVRESSIVEKSPAEILKILNRALYETGHSTTTMTFFAACIDLKEGVMTFANAGHNQPFLMPRAHPDPRLSSRKGAERFHHCKLKAAGSPLGLEADAHYVDTRMEIAGGDKIVFYTDGLFECVNSANVRWGELNMRKTLDTHFGLQPAEFQEALLKEAFTHFAGQATHDDITLVTLDIAADWRRRSLSEVG